MEHCSACRPETSRKSKPDASGGLINIESPSFALNYLPRIQLGSRCINMVKCSFRYPLNQHGIAAAEADADTDEPPRFAPVLPIEIILHILRYLGRSRSKSQPALYNFALVCRSWYAGSICLLHNSPHISQSSFHRFVNTICIPINARSQKNGLAERISTLNLGSLPPTASGLLTAKVLGRVRVNLKVFFAPPTSFS